MAMEITKYRIPIKFEFQQDSNNDSRFKKVKIWIAHTGENLNNSYFTKEMLEKLATTLPYIPIVGFIEDNSDGEEDYSDHRQVLEIKDGAIKMEYKGKAYGFIPEDPNAKIEVYNGKEWLTAEGYMWTKFTTAIKILEDGGGVKSQSMEIQDVDGEVDEMGRLVFSEGRFDALCILGDHVNPGMTGSTIRFFSENNIQESLKEMIREFSLHEKEGSTIPTDEKTSKEFEEDVKEVEQEVVEQVDETEETVEEPVEETTEEVEQEQEQTEEESDGEADTVDENTEEETEVEAEVEGEEFSEKETALFEMSHYQIRKKLGELTKSQYDTDTSETWIAEVFSDHVICEVYDYQAGSTKYMDVKYENVDDTLTLGEAVEVQPMFVTSDEAKAIEDNRAYAKQLESELASLKQYKAEVETAEKEAVLAEFAEKLSAEDVEAVRAQFSELDVKGVEKEVAYIHFQKTKEENQPTGQPVAFSVDFDKNEAKGRYGNLSRYFTKD